jgi:hypothetical protein
VKAWEDLVGCDLTPAEVKLIKACLAGQPCVLGEDRPDAPSDMTKIRAPILKVLITDSLRDQPTTDIGVHLEGAYISGLLDLWMSRAKGLTGLLKCRFDHGLEAMQAQFEILNLSGSDLPALNAPGARVAGDVFLNNGFHANGEVILSGAEIGGQLSCTGGRFEYPERASWETFNRYAWAADVVIPILDFGQTQAWTPTTARGWAGCTLWWGNWVLSAAGWIVLAFAAAGVTGVARRD